MLNIIILVFSAMGLVAFGGVAYSYASYMAYDYQALLDLYVLFASGVGIGVCFMALWESLVWEWAAHAQHGNGKPRSVRVRVPSRHCHDLPSYLLHRTRA